MAKLFPDVRHLNLPDGDISYFPEFLSNEKADDYFKVFLETVPWQQDDIKVFGKVYAQPRLTALYGNNKKPYTYSGLTMHPHEFTKELLDLKRLIETHTDVHFTSCLLNLYRDGQDSNGWHADDEKELGTNPVIASISLGQERFFHLKYRQDPSLKHKIPLEHGSLLLMKGSTQHHWLHQIAKTAKPIAPRINLTFRVIQ
ncbi:MAG: alpha-ketoglutarate-dependent dioxygenase AlkB [Flavobacteriales bacterium]|nr:MAG: alpha-ketoglutarate-dependent dioxygenase AlkB [Flavobacteriales bacterium]